MIDVHCHLLPGLDDGPGDDLESIAMARVAAANGIEQTIATPHVREDHLAGDAAPIRRAVGRLQALLDAEEIPLVVRPGAEVAIGPALELDGAALRDLTLAGAGTLLLETPHARLPSIFEAVVDRLLDQGLRVLLAHPELNPDLQADPSRLGAMVERGALVQITATSLEPGGKARHKQLAAHALDRGWAHVVATDSHSSVWRPPVTGEAREVAGPLWEWLTHDVPSALVTGAPIPERPVPVAPPPKRGGRWLAWRR